MHARDTASRRIIDLPFNRAEGDLEVRVEHQDGVITDAWSAGTLYRGFENLMVGRAPLDGLVITPRVCGICTTTHLTAAARALDAIAGVTPPANARRLRHLALASEHVQSDVRQSVLMFMADFASPAHAGQPLHEEAVRRYRTISGTSFIEVIRETKKILEVVALIGGQWPHSSFMVPGGLAFAPSQASLLQCRQRVADYRRWYETRVLGCAIETWREVEDRGLAALDRWLDQAAAHRDGEVGFLWRFGRDAGLDRIGRGHQGFLSFGEFGELGPADLAAAAESGVAGDFSPRVPAGVVRGRQREVFDASRINEDVSHAWYRNAAGAPEVLPPTAGETQPYASGREGRAYSWVKAPRYDGAALETGPLAEAIVAGRRLYVDALDGDGVSALVRQLARLTRPATLLPAMSAWIDACLANPGAPIVEGDGRVPDGAGIGLVQAARGALGHWVNIRHGRIERYQMITPTAWNGSPRDRDGRRGAWEEALIGTPIADPERPVEAGYVIRSFDPCLVCAVHAVHRSG